MIRRGRVKVKTVGVFLRRGGQVQVVLVLSILLERRNVFRNALNREVYYSDTAYL